MNLDAAESPRTASYAKDPALERALAEANAWLAHMVSRLTGAAIPDAPAPAWSIGATVPVWDDPALRRAMDLMTGIVELGRAHGLLSWREPWLLGWKQGLPGAQLSGILAMLDHALGLEPSDAALAYLDRRRDELARSMELLAKGLAGYLLAERLSRTLLRVDPEAVPERGLREARTTLFGPPPGAGGTSAGLCGRALAILEECIHLTAKEDVA